MTAYPLDNVVTASQGSPGPISGSWPVILTDLTQSIGTITHPLFVTGSIGITNVVTVTGSVVTQGSATVQQISGTVSQADQTQLNATVFQGTTPWVISGSFLQGVTGSVGLSAPANVTQGTTPWQVSGTVSQADITKLNATITGSVGITNVVTVTGTLSQTPVGVQQISGTVSQADQTQLKATVFQGTSPWVISGSFLQDVSGSVALSQPATVLQGTSPWVVSSSILQNITGSVAIAGIPTVTGSVVLSQPATVLQGTSPWVVSSSQTLTVQGAPGGQAVSVSGTVTSNQGSPNTLANAWPMQLSSSSIAAVIQNGLTPAVGDPALTVAISPNVPTIPISGTNTLNVQGVVGGQAVSVSGTVTVNQGLSGTTSWPTLDVASGLTGSSPPAWATAVAATDGNALQPLSSRYDQRLRTGRDKIIFFDDFAGTGGILTGSALNWRASTNTFIFGTSKPVDFNSTALSGGSSASSIDTWRRFPQPLAFPLILELRARVSFTATGAYYFGLGGTHNLAVNAAPNTGAFFKVDASGNVTGNVASTVTGTLVTLSTTLYYTFRITARVDGALFQVMISDGSVIASAYLSSATNLRNALQASITAERLNIFAKAITAGDLFVDSVVLIQGDSDDNITFAATQAAAQRTAAIDPMPASQNAQWSNSAQPSNAVLSNSAASYSTLGGRFQFSPVAGAEIDYALFAYSPSAGSSISGRTLIVTGISIDTWCSGSDNGVLATVLEWGIAVGSSAADLSTTGQNPPIRVPLGVQTLPAMAIVGSQFTPRISERFDSPLAVTSFFTGGGFIHIILRIPQGLTVSGQTIRGMVRVEGYWLT